MASSQPGVREYFHFIKEEVSSDWKDLAFQLVSGQVDINKIASRNRDDKSRCMDLLEEWLKRNGDRATLEVLVEALSKAGLQSTVDGLNNRYGASSARLSDNSAVAHDNEGPIGSSSDEESLQENYRLLRISDKIFDEELMDDPEKLERMILDFKIHVDKALPYFKLSCKAKLQVRRRTKRHFRRTHRVVFERFEREMKGYGKMVECFGLYCATLKKIEDGCVLCTLEFDDIPALTSFLRGYRDGKLSKTLTKEFITEEMKQAAGADLYVHVRLLVAKGTTKAGVEASAAAAPVEITQYYLSNVPNVQIGMQTQMSIASAGLQNRTSSEIAAEDHLEQVMTSCRSILRNEYRRNLSRIQPLPWNRSFCVPIDDVYTNLDLMEETIQGFKLNRVSLGSMEDIFRPSKKLGRRRPLRIVMQGQAGVGKTTSLTKLALDWSMEKVQALERFDLAFVLRLPLIGQEMSIIDVIFDQLMPKGFPFTKEDLGKCLEHKQGQVLIMLDGYDEFHSARCPEIVELLKGRMYPRAVVMTTTRPSKIDEIRSTADIVVEITGFSPENASQYLKRHFQGQEGKVQELLQQLEPYIANRGIATIPMFTMLISVLYHYEDKPDIIRPATITGLYQELISCIIKRYRVKHGEDAGGGDMTSILEMVSEIAFECLMSDKVSFGEAELIDKANDRRVAELGVFTYDETQAHSRVNGGRHLTFSHKTIQEYLAGCYLASIFTTSKRETKKYLSNIDTLQRVSELKFAILFACGTSERAATVLIEHLLRIWKNSPGETKKQKQQDFVKLSIQCLYESKVKDRIQLPVLEMFPSGKVEFYDVSADVVKYLSHYLQHLKQVEAVTEVSLEDVRDASFQDADDLGTAFRRLNVMHTLRVSRSPHFIIKPIIENLEKMPSLQHLYLCGMDFREEGKTLAVALKRMHRAKRTLKTLRVADNNFSQEASESLLTAIGKLTSLTDIDVSVNDLEDTLETLSDSLKHLSELRTLNLRESGLTQKACIALGGAFKTCPLGNLEECNLEGNQVDDRASVQVLLEGLGALTNLRNLNLKGCLIGPDGAVTLSVSLQTMALLRVVNLEGNGLDIRAAKSLFTSLHHCPELETVDLNTNFLGSQGVGEFAANFEKVGRLTSLNLSHNVVGDEGLEAVSRRAHHLQHLQYLDLSDNAVTNDGFGSFFKSLPEMAALKELDVSGPYDATDDCVEHLSQALSRLPSLEVLHLRHVAMTPDGFDTFMEAAENHGKLTTVSYGWENLPPLSDYSDSSLLVLW